MPREYGKKAQEKVKEKMEEMKRGELKSGKSGKKVTNRKQAVGHRTIRSTKRRR